MQKFKNILVATDTRLDDHPIVKEAAELARLNGADLTIVDVVPEFSWTVRFVMHDHEHVRELIGHEKAEKLEALATPLRASGLNVTTKVLYGKTSVEIIRQVLRGKHDLLLRVAKGSDSKSVGYFGETGVRLLRKCPCAVWLVSPDSEPKFTHVLGCVDPSTGHDLDAELNDNVFELSSAISEYHGGKFSIAHAWSVYGEQMIKGRMDPEEFEEVVNKSETHAAELLDRFLEKHNSTVRAENVHLLKGDTPELIPKFVRENDVDLVVMGTVARSGIAGVLMGNTAEKILNDLHCSVLALKPSSFVCPINLD